MLTFAFEPELSAYEPLTPTGELLVPSLASSPSHRACTSPANYSRPVIRPRVAGACSVGRRKRAVRPSFVVWCLAALVFVTSAPP